MHDMEPKSNLLPSGEVDHEGAMARADLYKLANYSVKLYKKLDENTQLEGWVQAKITKAADYIASVYHYLEYEMEFSKFGSKLENSDMYSESEKLELKQKLAEAKEMLKHLKVAQAQKLEEAKSPKAKKDWDGDGKIESDKDEVWGSRMKAAKKAGKMEESWDDDDEDPDVKKADSELKKKGVKLPKVKHKEVPIKKTAKDKEEELDEGSGPYALNDPKHPKFKANYEKFKKANPDKKLADFVDSMKKKEKTGIDESWDDDDEDPDVKRADSELKKRGVKLPKVKHKEVPIKKTAKDKEEELDEGGIRSTARRVVTRAISNDPETKKALGKEGVKKNKQISRDEHKNASKEDLKKVVDRNRSSKVSEGSKPDFLDLDKDGNKKEPMKKAAKEKKCDEAAPSAGLSAKQKSATVKKAKAGGDIGKPGKGFAKVEKAAKAGGAKDPKAVAAAAMWKNIKREDVAESVETTVPTLNESAELDRLKEFLTRLNG